MISKSEEREFREAQANVVAAFCQYIQKRVNEFNAEGMPTDILFFADKNSIGDIIPFNLRESLIRPSAGFDALRSFTARLRNVEAITPSILSVITKAHVTAFTAEFRRFYQHILTNPQQNQEILAQMKIMKSLGHIYSKAQPDPFDETRVPGNQNGYRIEDDIIGGVGTEAAGGAVHGFITHYFPAFPYKRALTKAAGIHTGNTETVFPELGVYVRLNADTPSISTLLKQGRWLRGLSTSPEDIDGINRELIDLHMLGLTDTQESTARCPAIRRSVRDTSTTNNETVANIFAIYFHNYFEAYVFPQIQKILDSPEDLKWCEKNMDPGELGFVRGMNFAYQGIKGIVPRTEGTEGENMGYTDQEITPSVLILTYDPHTRTFSRG